MLTLTRQGLLLSLSATVIPSQGSSDVPVAVVNDINTYVGYTLEPRVGYYLNGIYKSTVCTYDTSAKTFSVPAEAFKQIGIIDITLALIDNANANHIETCQTVHATVNKAPLGTVVLPDQTTWQDYVNSYMNQLFDSNYKPQFDQIQQDLENLVTEAQQQQQTAEQQQTQIDNAISVMGEYQIVSNDPVQIQFKKGDGTFGPTVDLGDGLASKSMVNAGYYQSIGSQYSGSASDYGIQVEEIVGAYSQGLNPSPDNPQEMQAVEISELKSSVRNMFDYQSIVDEATDNGLSANAVVEEKEGRDCLKLLASASITELMFLEGRFKENTQYKFSFTGLYSGSGNGLIIQALYIDGTNKYIYLNTPDAFQKIEMTTDPNKSIKAITFSYGSVAMGWLDLDSSYIVELSQDTGEFPGRFVGDTVTLSEPLILRALPSGVCDTWENGTLMQNIGEITFDGSADEGWAWQSFNVDLRNMYINIPLALKKTHLVLCNRLVSENSNPSQQINGSCYIASNGNFSCFFTEGQFNSLDDFKTWLSTHPLKVWYQLATPTTEAFEIETLQSWYPYTNAWCDSPLDASSFTWNILTGVQAVDVDSLKEQVADHETRIDQLETEVIPPTQLLVNTDFEINQRMKTTYETTEAERTYTFDMWYILKQPVKGGYAKVTSESGWIYNDADHITVELTGYGEFGQITSTPYNMYNNLTSVACINGTEHEIHFDNIQSELTATGEYMQKTIYYGDTANDGLIVRLYRIGNVISLFFMCNSYASAGSKRTFNLQYVDLWAGQYAYPHQKKTRVQDFMECCRFVYRWDFPIRNNYAYNGPKNVTGYTGTEFPVPMWDVPTAKVLELFMDSIDVTDEFVDAPCNQLRCSEVTLNGQLSTLRGTILFTCEPM